MCWPGWVLCWVLQRSWNKVMKLYFTQQSIPWTHPGQVNWKFSKFECFYIRMFALTTTNIQKHSNLHNKLSINKPVMMCMVWRSCYLIEYQIKNHTHHHRFHSAHTSPLRGSLTEHMVVLGEFKLCFHSGTTMCSYNEDVCAEWVVSVLGSNKVAKSK